MTFSTSRKTTFCFRLRLRKFTLFRPRMWNSMRRCRRTWNSTWNSCRSLLFLAKHILTQCPGRMCQGCRMPIELSHRLQQYLPPFTINMSLGSIPQRWKPTSLQRHIRNHHRRHQVPTTSLGRPNISLPWITTNTHRRASLHVRPRQ